jgi:hypothetical protein
MNYISKHGRYFLQSETPLLNAVAWETRIKPADQDFAVPYFYGKVTFSWGSTLVGIHSYAYHYGEARDKFVQKMMKLVQHIDDFCSCIIANGTGRASEFLNTEETPFSGSVFWMRGDTMLKGNKVSIFELGGCLTKIRLHSHEIGGEKVMLEVLGTLVMAIHELIVATNDVANELEKAKVLQ